MTFNYKPLQIKKPVYLKQPKIIKKYVSDKYYIRRVMIVEKSTAKQIINPINFDKKRPFNSMAEIESYRKKLKEDNSISENYSIYFILVN